MHNDGRCGLIRLRNSDANETADGVTLNMTLLCAAHGAVQFCEMRFRSFVFVHIFFRRSYYHSHSVVCAQKHSFPLRLCVVVIIIIAMWFMIAAILQENKRIYATNSFG